MNYKTDPITKQVQKYLPPKYRLNNRTNPEEYFIPIDRYKIHIDHYKTTNPKATVVMFHGVGGNGRLLSCMAIPLSKNGTEPEQFHSCPFFLVHPGEDRWTDISLSRKFYDRLACEKEILILKGAGHFPIEESGLQQLETACVSFLNKHI